MRRFIVLIAAVWVCGACSAPHPSSSSSGTGGTSTGASSSGSGASGTTGAGSTSSGTSGAGPGDAYCSAVAPVFCQLGEACRVFDANCAQLLVGQGQVGGPCGLPGQTFHPDEAAACQAMLQAALDAGSCDALQLVNRAPCSVVFQGPAAEGQACHGAMGTCSVNGQAFPCAISGNSGISDCAQRPDGGQVDCVVPSPAPDGGSCVGRCIAAPAGLGERCDLSTRCSSGFCELFADGGAICAPFLGDGADCSLNVDGCDPDLLLCAYPGTCVPRSGTGDACGASTTCVSRDVCEALPDGGDACEPGASLGQPCTPDGLGDAGACLAGTCVSGVCAIVLPGPGESCVGGVCGPNSDGGLLYCSAQPGSGSYQPACVPPSARGDSCGTQGDPPYCVGYPNFTCVGGTCQELPAQGQPCLFPSIGLGCRAGDYCAAGTCEPMPQLGDPCTSDGFCGVGYCDATHNCAAPLAVGASCDPQASQCASTSACSPSTALSMGSFFHGGALAPLWCVPGTCSPIGDGGGVCVAPAQCY